jgi:hypothetical protein
VAPPDHTIELGDILQVRLADGWHDLATLASEGACEVARKAVDTDTLHGRRGLYRVYRGGAIDIVVYSRGDSPLRRCGEYPARGWLTLLK